MKKTITEVETAIENRIAELEEEYELDIYDRNDIREEEYQKAGWRHDPFPEELRVRCDGGAAAEQKLPAGQHRLPCNFCIRASVCHLLHRQVAAVGDVIFLVLHLNLSLRFSPLLSGGMVYITLSP